MAAGVGAKPHGLKHEAPTQYGPPAYKHTEHGEPETGPGGNRITGNGEKKFTKANPLVNPKHKGYCTPMTKATCTPRRKAFAMRVKREGGFH